MPIITAELGAIFARGATCPVANPMTT